MRCALPIAVVGAVLTSGSDPGEDVHAASIASTASIVVVLRTRRTPPPDIRRAATSSPVGPFDHEIAVAPIIKRP
jgi:hypothetical protein